MKKIIIQKVFTVLHEVLATDHVVWGTTNIKADTKEQAFEFFNEKLADNRYIFKIKDLDKVKPLEVFGK